RRFTWTNSEGLAHNRRATLEDFTAFAAASTGDRDVELHFYGRMLTMRGSHDNARFVRVFVKRRHGWKAFLALETPIVGGDGTPASVERAAGPGDCDNPCRSVPYTPKSQMDKDILAAWQKTKMLEWKPDAEQWATFVADEFVIINNTTVRTKEQRVAIARRQQETGVGAPGDPVVAMRIYDFGNSAGIMISQHTPYRGGKPYSNLRIWVLRDNRWQLALSQQVTIQSSAAAPAVASTQ